MILVDTSVWVDYFRGVSARHTDALDQLLGREPMVIGDLILAEVLQGFQRDHDLRAAQRLLTALDPVIIGGHDLALRAARHFRHLRARGVTVRKTIDALIATRCLTDDLMLLHNDRDFDAFETHFGLRVVPV